MFNLLHHIRCFRNIAGWSGRYRFYCRPAWGCSLYHFVSRIVRSVSASNNASKRTFNKWAPLPTPCCLLKSNWKEFLLLIVFLDSINEEDLDGSVSVGHMAFLFTIRVQRGNQLFSSPFDSVQKGHTLRLGGIERGIDYSSVANTQWKRRKKMKYLVRTTEKLRFERTKVFVGAYLSLIL